MRRRPTLGAWPENDGIRFRVWAPDVEDVRLVIEGDPIERPMARDTDGYATAFVPGLRPGARYRYRLDGRGPFPDPASRFQPEGVHGPSEVIDPSTFAWSDASFRGRPTAGLVIYEIHVGAFTPEGTYAAATRRLAEVARLGANAIELMPLADFPGARGWGYDGVDLFAPARCYGRPDDLRRLVDEAHRLGLTVLLDVVFNHLGPDGNYLAQYSRDYFHEGRPSPWGPAIAFDGPRAAHVRRFFGENLLHWIHEYHLDGFRLDATHHLLDDGPRHILAELAAVAHAAEEQVGRPIHVIAEDPRNLTELVRPESAGGYGLDAIWADDFHHELRRLLVGDHEGVFVDFRGRVDDLVTIVNDGWLFRGQFSVYRGHHRGNDPAGLDRAKLVFCIQNHDRIGNRAHGERLNHQVDLATYRAATALLLLPPAIPLLFMGQEWAASTPFLFFCDHKPELGASIKAGRRDEFRHYAEFADPEQAARIPDCLDPATFRACVLDWEEAAREPHASIARFTKACIALRLDDLRRAGTLKHRRAEPLDDGTVAIRMDPEGDDLPARIAVVRLRGAGTVEVPSGLLPGEPALSRLILSSEDPEFTLDPTPPEIGAGSAGLRIAFQRPGALVIECGPAQPTQS